MYFFNPYKYILDYKDKLNIRVYDTNQPYIEKFETIYSGSLALITIENRMVTKTDNNLNIYYFLGKKSAISTLEIDKVYGQLEIKISNNSSLYYKGTIGFDEFRGYYLYFTIETDKYITSEDKTLFKNGLGKTIDAYISNEANIELTIYTISQNISDADHNYLD